ncbi:MAG: hypothetical protein CM15mP116_10630 [Synechococcus sp.]|nr:MAG: hypothetical protein CM15mP116_10630 [Synechococcus sp.]
MGQAKGTFLFVNRFYYVEECFEVTFSIELMIFSIMDCKLL